MKNLLLGNDIDIQFGGSSSTSRYIIRRIRYRALLDSFAELFDHKIAAVDIVKLLEGFAEEANDLIKGSHDFYVSDQNTKDSLDDFKTRYTKLINKPEDIMLEDWPFVVHMFS